MKKKEKIQKYFIGGAMLDESTNQSAFVELLKKYMKLSTKEEVLCFIEEAGKLSITPDSIDIYKDREGGKHISGDQFLKLNAN